MEKNFARLNYYEMLDLNPGATFFEIRHAYNTALNVYKADSLVSYSFFSLEERKEMLALLEKAYFTLINENARQEYDNELVRQGIFDSKLKVAPLKAPVCIFDIKRERGSVGTTKNAAELRVKIAESELIRGVLAQTEISGADFRKIRNELAVTLESVSRETKIRLEYLTAIEENRADLLPAAVFLKGFIKSYLKCLHLEPVDEICTRYLNNLTLAGK